MPSLYRLALIGFGNVGQGFAEILRDQGSEILKTYGAEFRIVAVNTLDIGTVENPEGIDPAQLLDSLQKFRNFKGVKANHPDWDALQTITDSASDIIVETTFTNLQTGQPAIQHIETAFNKHKSVVTTNKGPVALAYPRLSALARSNGLHFGVEGTVMSGTPTIHLGQDVLRSAGVRSLQGILNGTTNYILRQMENGVSYEKALADAQALGYAETDPSGDVEGFDAAGKVVILANLLMDANITMDDVERIGITDLTSEDIHSAQAAGVVWKLIGQVEIVDGKVKASVQPKRLTKSHPLASVAGVTNAITYNTATLGDITLIGPGAGRKNTGFAVLSDLLAIHRANPENKITKRGP